MHRSNDYHRLTCTSLDTLLIWTYWSSDVALNNRKQAIINNQGDQHFAGPLVYAERSSVVQMTRVFGRDCAALPNDAKIAPVYGLIKLGLGPELGDVLNPACISVGLKVGLPVAPVSAHPHGRHHQREEVLADFLWSIEGEVIVEASTRVLLKHRNAFHAHLARLVAVDSTIDLVERVPEILLASLRRCWNEDAIAQQTLLHSQGHCRRILPT